jgi:hypothetical protein
MAAGPMIERIGSAARYLKANAAHNFKRGYYEHIGSGDVRVDYEDLYVSGGGSGEVMRLRGIANGLLTAAGGTLNALHATGRVAAGKTVSGALNAIRATLEVAGTNPTPGGTLSALQLDSNIVTGATLPGTVSMARVSQSGAVKVPNLFQLPVPGAKTAGATDLFVARHADATATHAIAVVDDAGTRYWINVTTDTPAD